jgi:mycothiol synthase
VEIRRPRPTTDFDEVLALVQASDRAVYGDSDWTAAELREEWDGLDVSRDAWVAVEDGRLAGVMHVYERRGGRVLADGYVHPELTGRGVGAALLEAAEQRALELAAEVQAGEEVSIETAHLVGDPRAPELLVGRGYEPVRTFWRMVVDLTGAVPTPVWPEGIELRPFDLERDGRRVHSAVEAAFEHEWGHEPRDYEAWMDRAVDVAQFDPQLFLVAWDADGDEVAAVSLAYAKRMGDWGWIATLGVRPAWRRRGLGLALLHESFRRLAERGEATAALGVDSENPTGATRLYERAGMRIFWRTDVWRKELRPVPPALEGTIEESPDSVAR